MTVQIIDGDCLATLRTLTTGSAQCCVTSPPYYGLRSYDGGDAEIGKEETPAAYVARLVEVFAEVRRVLRDDGTLWLNIGDSYAGSGGGANGGWDGGILASKGREDHAGTRGRNRIGGKFGIKPKDLLMIPAQVALALRADGWWLRSDIIWHKPNPMPESITDRPTSAHEHVFLLSKAERYFYDAKAIAEAATYACDGRRGDGDATQRARLETQSGGRGATHMGTSANGTRNARNVWTIPSQPYSGTHFATMPPELAERCIKAGTKPGDTVLDPFSGAGTTCLVADRLGRHSIGCELNPTYAALSRSRIQGDAGLFASVI